LIPYSFAALVYAPKRAFALGGGVIISGDDLLREISLLTALATSFELDSAHLNMGLTFKLHSASFGKNGDSPLNVQGDALGFSVDWGIQLFLSEKIILASQLQNLFTGLRWNTSTLGRYREDLPQTWIFGIGLRDFRHLNFDLDIHKSLYRDIEDQIYLGAEQLLFSRAYLRAGTAAGLNQTQQLFYTIGGGVQQGFQNRLDFQLDAAYIIHPLANMFRLSLTFRSQ